MIEFKKVTKDYVSNIGKEVKPALKDISFSVKEGEFVTLCGRSGAGKTTILKMIACEEKPNSGNISFLGRIRRKLRRGKLLLLGSKWVSFFRTLNFCLIRRYLRMFFMLLR